MRQVLDDLSQNDRLGIITFGRTTRTAIDINAPFNRNSALDAIDAITADGDTRMFPGLEAARDALNGATTELKMIIMLSDGDRLTR